MSFYEAKEDGIPTVQRFAHGIPAYDSSCCHCRQQERVKVFCFLHISVCFFNSFFNRMRIVFN
jgi:hypothetical protein